ncbi:hypothetical protein, partial [Klebsiella pneumoniae]|uniref:hypothetical protein n=1 Tax=Klebsiella pneumoniae TaxID=573 RepID=UPI0025A199DF
MKGHALFEGRTIRVEKFKVDGKSPAALREIVLRLLTLGGASVKEQGPCVRETLVITNDEDI